MVQADAGLIEQGGKPMIRKLILPAIAVLLLAGCATGYSYRSASGDYYYGQPTTVYRDYYGGYGYYGYPYYGYSPYRWGGSIRYSWGYPYGYYGRYPGYYWWRHAGSGHHSPRPGNDQDDHDRTPDRATPPWRDLDRIRGDRGRPDVPRADDLRVRPVQPARPVGQAQARPMPQSRPAQVRPVQQARPQRVRSSSGGGAHKSAPAPRSKMSELIRRAQSD